MSAIAPETKNGSKLLKSHRLRGKHRKQPGPAWPSYKGTNKLVGTSKTKVNVYVDPTLGEEGLKNAQSLLADADRIVNDNNAIFGTPGGEVNVIIFAIDGLTDGTGGADHMACNYTDGNNIEVCASFGSPARVSGLFEAELSECSMDNNLCGESTGEALSRWCAMAISNNALPDFQTGQQWFDDGMPNFVDKTDDSDGHPDSTGCAMIFLSWLQGKIGLKLSQIAPAMVGLGDPGTLAQLYAKLTGDAASNAWTKFQADIKALGGPITGDDPFGGFTPAP